MEARPGEVNDVFVSTVPWDGQAQAFIVQDVAGVRAGPGCESSGEQVARCALARRLRVLLGDGNDVVRASLLVPMTVSDGPGDDRVDGSRGDDVLLNDAGTDAIAGGPGDDVIEHGPGPDNLQGGMGADTIDYSSATEPVRVDSRDFRTNHGPRATTASPARTIRGG